MPPKSPVNTWLVTKIRRHSFRHAELHPSPSIMAPSSHSSLSSTLPSPQLAAVPEEPDPSEELVDEEVVVAVVPGDGIDVDIPVVVVLASEGSLASEVMPGSLASVMPDVLELAGLPVPSTMVVVQALHPSNTKACRRGTVAPWPSGRGFASCAFFQI